MKTLGSLLQVPPKTLNSETLYLVGLVTVAAVIHLISMSIRVGSARHKYKVVPPKIDGPAPFNLVYRAHQNSVENFPIFLGALWTAAIFFHQIPAAIFGVFYIVAREIYFLGYSSKAERRGLGFALSFLSLLGLVALASVGAGAAGYRAYRGQDILKGWLQYIPVPYL
ncbi:microsomal glutathione S-transferase 2-like [Paramacrobiotus metropolitanus]|uniref:microsomal glutathione S-transferase 2-like n=1 Tax=Paramacrobiotus metropolitanus TaxID=2943436 RepID=UPI002445D401|nr:microsomal glutathione S-transferase 2-like [Paramacrobiotus metropolitanus]